MCQAADRSVGPSSSTERPRRRKLLRVLGVGSCCVLLGYALLMVPGAELPPPAGAGFTPFEWGQDSLWDTLERRFALARQAACSGERRSEALGRLDASLSKLQARAAAADDPAWPVVESALFDSSVEVAACPSDAGILASLVSRLRTVVKRQSETWSPDSRGARERVYRLLYGSRAAYEEVLAQLPDAEAFELMRGTDEPSRAPSYTFRGVTLRSGDILVSRGGAPTSALIARGNDFVGNFSHIALLHVSTEGVARVVEAHIERGVAVSSPEEYLADKKLRIMVLRPRANLPQLVKDPLLAHRVASEALALALAGHIPYDFAMDVEDHREVFCSEVASAPYARHGVRLWQGLSSISGPGVTRWLYGLGVRHFRTFSPSDLEYDAALRVVAEWRSASTLFQDRRDNAVLDVLLERADAGEQLKAPLYLLPPVRVAKGWSLVLNLFGTPGPVPEGMSATSALRVRDLDARHHALATRLDKEADAFLRDRGYRPPYWELVKLARKVEQELRD